jgi:hypothetical protein
MSIPFRGPGHENETVAEYNRRMEIGAPGLMTNGRGVRSSGESLDPGVRRLAAMSFGRCVETGQYVDLPGGRREPVMRPVRTEGELDAQLLAHGKRRGTVAEANARFEQMKAEQGKPEPVAPREPTDAQVYAVKNRREKFRSDFDNGAIPKREIPADVAPLIPKV